MSRLSCVSGCRCKAGWGEGLGGGGLNWLGGNVALRLPKWTGGGKSSQTARAARQTKQTHKNVVIVSQYGRVIVVYSATIVAIYDLGLQDCVKKKVFTAGIFSFSFTPRLQTSSVCLRWTHVLLITSILCLQTTQRPVEAPDFLCTQALDAFRP